MERNPTYLPVFSCPGTQIWWRCQPQLLAWRHGWVGRREIDSLVPTTPKCVVQSQAQAGMVCIGNGMVCHSYFWSPCGLDFSVAHTLDCGACEAKGVSWAFPEVAEGGGFPGHRVLSGAHCSEAMEAGRGLGKACCLQGLFQRGKEWQGQVVLLDGLVWAWHGPSFSLPRPGRVGAAADWYLALLPCGLVEHELCAAWSRKIPWQWRWRGVVFLPGPWPFTPLTCRLCCFAWSRIQLQRQGFKRQRVKSEMRAVSSSGATPALILLSWSFERKGQHHAHHSCLSCH